MSIKDEYKDAFRNIRMFTFYLGLNKNKVTHQFITMWSFCTRTEIKLGTSFS